MKKNKRNFDLINLKFLNLVNFGKEYFQVKFNFLEKKQIKIKGKSFKIDR